MSIEILNKINFMSDERFSEIEDTSDNELYLVEYANYIDESGVNEDGSHGFIRLKNKVLICWGMRVASNSSLTFMRPFANTNYLMNFYSVITASGNGNTQHSMVFRSGKTTTGVNNLMIGQSGTTGHLDSSYTHNYIAIGLGA